MIARVIPNSPAAKAGLRGLRETLDGELILGDIIIAIDNKTVRNYDDLLNYLEQKRIGDTVTLKIWRFGKVFKVKVKLY